MFILVIFSLFLTSSLSLALNLQLNNRFNSYIRSNFKARVSNIINEIRAAYIQAGSLEKLRLKQLNLSHTMGLEVEITDANGRKILTESRHMPGHSASMMQNMHQMVGVSPKSQTAPLYVNDKKIATVKITSMMEDGGLWSKQDVDFKNRLNSLVHLAGIVGGIAAIVLSFLLAKSLTKPMTELSNAALEWGKGNFKTRAKTYAKDEIGQLASLFNKMANNLESQRQQRQNMLADISHELRTPLTVLENNLEALQDGILEPSTQNLQSLHDEIIRLTHLIDDLQTLALTDSASITLNKTKIDITAAIKEVVNQMQVFLQTKKIKIDFDNDKKIMVNADYDKFKQVIFNILFNAYKYLENEGLIKISIKASGSQAIINMADNGPGIKPHQLPKIFDRFYSSQKEGGSGIGLAVVKQLIEAHNGTIKVESKINKGTNFTIVIGDGSTI